MAGRVRVASPDESVSVFWRRHARLGIVLSGVVLVQIGLYAALADEVRHVAVLLALVGAGAAVTAVATVLARVVVGRGRQRVFFLLWSLAAVAVVLAATAVDGGERSPIVTTLFLPLLFAALAYPPPAVLVVGVLELVGYVAVVAVTGGRSTAQAAVVGSTQLIATLMATKAAGNRSDQQRQLRALATRLRRQATHDALTGCLNRRGFDVAVDLELARVQRHGRPLALLLVDVDRLKEINDRSGHRAGDEALRACAAALHAVARRSDVVARIGGDEFAVLAPETDVQESLLVARRVHTEIARQRSDLRPTLSIGVASVHRPVEPGELMHAADRALYAAKRAGRGCTRTADLSAAAARVDPAPVARSVG